MIRRLSTKSEGSAIAARFEQILDEQLHHTTGNTQQVKNDVQKAYDLEANSNNPLNPTHNDLRHFPYTPQTFDLDSAVKARLYIRSENLLQHNKHARDIFNAEPWTGKESMHDSNLRMLVDSKPPPKRRSGAQKVNAAKESSLDYRLQRDHPQEPSFKEMYTEKLLGPSMLVNTSSVDLVNSVASAKINASINQSTGQFDNPTMSSVRGKPLDREHLRNCTDNNYFMNQILNKQKVLPPWVENQKSLESETTMLRKDLDKMWFKWFLTSSPVALQLIDTKPVNELIGLADRIASIKYSLTHLNALDLAYLDERFKVVNQGIRTYNLQSPSSSFHRFKLVKELEIQRSFQRSVERFPETIAEWHRQNNTPKVTVQWGGESKGEGLGFWRAVKDLFGGA